MSARLRCSVIDESPEFLHVLGLFLVDLPEVETVKLFGSGVGALSRALDQSPDVLFLDVLELVFEGIFTLQHLKLQMDAPYIIIMSGVDGLELRAMALEGGADAFVLKTECSPDIIRIIQEVRQARPPSRRA